MGERDNLLYGRRRQEEAEENAEEEALWTLSPVGMLPIKLYLN